MSDDEKKRTDPIDDEPDSEKQISRAGKIWLTIVLLGIVAFIIWALIFANSMAHTVEL